MGKKKSKWNDHGAHPLKNRNHRACKRSSKKSKKFKRTIQGMQMAANKIILLVAVDQELKFLLKAEDSFLHDLACVRVVI